VNGGTEALRADARGLASVASIKRCRTKRPRKCAEIGLLVGAGTGMGEPLDVMFILAVFDTISHGTAVRVRLGWARRTIAMSLVA
jgi:hypothetical protein